MTHEHYITRTLYDENRRYSENELLTSSPYIIVLAEPGAGKTELLSSLAIRLKTVRISASRFRYSPSPLGSNALVLDAFDEVSKISSESIFELLGKAQATGASRVVISSRSSEWDSTCTHRFKEFYNQEPVVVRLVAFTLEEQKQLFDHYASKEDFTQFSNEISRFDLDSLLPNPQFLKLFADAYIESDRQFTDKRFIFEKAIDHLAREVNPSVSEKGVTPLKRKIEFANEVFAKLLLCGAEGVASNDKKPNRLYPRLTSLSNNDLSSDCILETRLFKPADNIDQHQPVHKIISEYCAAKYLVHRIADNTDTLSLSQYLAIIAPNSTVRDELRGMLGWMATLGSETLQKAIIELDPYAVLANGDPSQLSPVSKIFLLHKLKDTATKNPLFRRGDRWRTFSAAGFFTNEVVGELKSLLIDTDGYGDLHGLILELLTGSPAIQKIVDELHNLMHDPKNTYHTRSLASQRLLEIPDHDHKADASKLTLTADKTSLDIAAGIIEHIGSDEFGEPFIANFLRACEHLYPRRNQRERTFGKRYFIKKFILSLDLPITVWLLNELTHGLSCTCGKNVYECDCRNGASKIIGILLDRYFTISNSSNPAQVWEWIKNLNFHKSKSVDQSNAVRELQQNDELRQGIIRLAFENETNSNKIRKIYINQFGWNNHSHSGLCFQQQDFRFTVDLAFASENIELWSYFIAIHHYPRSKEEYKRNELRSHMREQAKQNPKLMRAWVKKNRTIESSQHNERKSNLRHNRLTKKREKLQAEIHQVNIEYVTRNRELIESGRHWGCLHRFAYLVLMKPDQIETEFGDAILVKNSLKNCIDFIKPDTPSLQKLAMLQCNSQTLHWETILYAACLEIWRTMGSLENINPDMLAALRTNIDMHYQAVSDEERSALRTEVERLIFSKTDKVENFLRSYIEPQLEIPSCNHPQVSLLQYDETFKAFQNMLPLEWLQRFHDLPLNTLNELFELAAKFGNRIELVKHVEKRCSKIMSDWPDKTEDKNIEQLRIFWLVRAFYFLPKIPDTYWSFLTEDKETILTLNGRSGGLSHSEYSHWPTLSAIKVKAILDAFSNAWPKVELPQNWGNTSPSGEQAYRFLTEIIWNIGKDTPENALPVLSQLIGDDRLTNFEQDLRSIRATALREQALRNFEAPSPQEIVALLDEGEVATVEGLRALLLDELKNYQADLYGSETTSKEIFYEKGERIGEVPAALIITDRMRLRLEGKGITVTPEHQLQNANRCDFTCTKVIGTHRKLLVTEVKGQWHREIYTAASEQLHKRYSIHPDAEQQGVYLVLWFGKNEKVAGKKNELLSNANDLKQSIENSMSTELQGLVDVFVLDLSRAT